MPLKFKEPILIVATYRIVTPMFIGDANQKASGISPASVKGALRFWWRALNWSRIRAKEQSDTVALQHLHSEESELFGSSADKGVAAKFTLRVTCSSKASPLQSSPKSGIQYLLGQGLFHFREGYLREALGEN
jgi:CRISPR-associated protein Cmr1